jgi:hypothetical protein
MVAKWEVNTTLQQNPIGKPCRIKKNDEILYLRGYIVTSA